jgi:hypothetical protein
MLDQAARNHIFAKTHRETPVTQQMLLVWGGSPVAGTVNQNHREREFIMFPDGAQMERSRFEKFQHPRLSQNRRLHLWKPVYLQNILFYLSLSQNHIVICDRSLIGVCRAPGGRHPPDFTPLQVTIWIVWCLIFANSKNKHVAGSQLATHCREKQRWLDQIPSFTTEA